MVFTRRTLKVIQYTREVRKKRTGLLMQNGGMYGSFPWDRAENEVNAKDYMNEHIHIFRGKCLNGDVSNRQLVDAVCMRKLTA